MKSCAIIHVSLFFSHRLPIDQWWLKVRPLMRILSKHTESSYVTEGALEEFVDLEEIEDY